MPPQDSKDWILPREVLMRGATTWRQTQKKDYDDFRADMEKTIETLGRAIIELGYKFCSDKQKTNDVLIEVLGLARITDELKHQAMAFKALLAEGAARGDATARVMLEELVKLMKEVKENSIDKLHVWTRMEAERASLYREEMVHWRIQIDEADAKDNKPLAKKSRGG